MEKIINTVLNQDTIKSKVLELLGREVPVAFSYEYEELGLSDTEKLPAIGSQVLRDEQGNTISEYIIFDIKRLKISLENFGFIRTKVLETLEPGNIPKSFLETYREEAEIYMTNMIKHEVGHIISISKLSNAEYIKHLEEEVAFTSNITYNEMFEVKDKYAFKEYKETYYNLSLERIANEVFGLTYLDL